MFRSSYKLTEYSEDILSWIRIREVQMYQVQLQSPQLDRRRQLVEWTGSVAAQLKLSTQTVHLAIRYMDVFMSGHNIEEPQLYLVSICSLLLGSKMCERENNIPRLSVLVSMLPAHGIPDPLTTSDLFSLEVVMLKYLDWDLNFPTSCYITELLLHHSLSSADLKTSCKLKVPYNSFAEMKLDFLKTIKEMLDISLTEESMMQTMSSLMALSVLQASRLVIGLTWSLELDLMTGYQREEAQYLTDCLLSLYKLQSEEEVVIIDEGYISRDCSINNSTIASEK